MGPISAASADFLLIWAAVCADTGNETDNSIKQAVSTDNFI
jgi:hypothetical protein